MSTFPIILNSNKLSINDFNNLIEANRDYILQHFHIEKLFNDKLQSYIDKHEVEMDNLKEENLELKNIVDLKEKQHGTHSMYKGEFEEKKKEFILKEYFGNDFIIDGDKKMNCMDIRMNHRTKDYSIGIECKDKKNITKNDIEKFKDDKLKNKFKGSIFISISSPITKIIDEKDTFKLLNDELYIYSKDTHFIMILLKFFVDTLADSKRCENREEYSERLMNQYVQWTSIKKACLKFDKTLVKDIEKLGLKLTNGHLYLVSKTNCKKEESPYTKIK